MMSFVDGSNQIKRALEWLEKHDTPIVPAPVTPVSMPNIVINNSSDATKVMELSEEIERSMKATLQSMEGFNPTFETHQNAINALQNTIENMKQNINTSDANTAIMQALERISEYLAKQGEQPAPVVNVAAPVVNVPAPIVNISKDKQPARMLEVMRDNNGRITGIREK